MRYTVWMKIDGRFVKKKVSADSEEKAKEIAIKESKWFAQEIEIISISEGW